jgi:uncharacterized repeat protein (TIGR03803 family)
MKTSILNLFLLPAMIFSLTLIPTVRVTAQTCTVIHSFTNSPDGANPYASLMQAEDGNFYSTTEAGGAFGNGIIFEITSAGVLTTLASCNTNGVLPAGPLGALLQADDGSFYGVARNGGPTNLTSYPIGPGAVFKVTTNGTITTFGQLGYPNGSHPYGGLVRGADGNYYGTTKTGGTSSDGAIYELSADGTLSSLYTSFNRTNGANPEASLVSGNDGILYGVTTVGGASNEGTAFKITLGGTFATLTSFNGANGSNPYGSLVQGSDGNFYGTTYGGGTNNLGTIFQLTTNGGLTTLISFNGSNGANPYAALIRGMDGNFYGTTYGGGTSNLGTVFQITTNSALTTLISFNGSNGANPYAALIQDLDGYFYGTTLYGGVSNAGTVIRLWLLPTPQISIIPYGADVFLTWPTNAFVFNLQSATNLASPAAWSTVSPGPVVIGGQNVMINPISGTQQFYRLMLSQ